MNPLTDLPQILIRELGRPTGMFLARFKNSKFSGFTLIEKVWFTGKAEFPTKFKNLNLSFDIHTGVMITGGGGLVYSLPQSYADGNI